MLVDGWFLTSDVGRLDEDGRLQVLGRVDDVVISGGVNVPTPAVAARLREHPAVARGRGARRARRGVGQRVVAVRGRRRWRWTRRATGSASAHPRSWAPRALVAVDELPLLPNGKPTGCGCGSSREAGA